MATRQAQGGRKRTLVLMASGKRMGWFCECCSWNQPLPAGESERDQLARRIRQLFEAHSCEGLQKRDGS